jgi:hypothetical protein
MHWDFFNGGLKDLYQGSFFYKPQGTVFCKDGHAMKESLENHAQLCDGCNKLTETIHSC